MLMMVLWLVLMVVVVVVIEPVQFSPGLEEELPKVYCVRASDSIEICFSSSVSRNKNLGEEGIQPGQKQAVAAVVLIVGLLEVSNDRLFRPLVLSYFQTVR
jgi:hypothetical protein